MPMEIWFVRKFNTREIKSAIQNEDLACSLSNIDKALVRGFKNLLCPRHLRYIQLKLNLKHLASFFSLAKWMAHEHGSVGLGRCPRSLLWFFLLIYKFLTLISSGGRKFRMQLEFFKELHSLWFLLLIFQLSINKRRITGLPMEMSLVFKQN